MPEGAGKPAIGLELVTLYAPAFWGVESDRELLDLAEKEPASFWERMLDSVVATGVSGVELCFPPGDWRSAVAGYGSADRFAAALRGRGLGLVSSFFDAFDAYRGPLSPSDEAVIMRVGVESARFLQVAGGRVLVTGMPALERGSPGTPMLYDLEYGKRLAGFLNRLGAAVAEEGVQLALHTEIGSVFCRRRDIDLIMLLTDPGYVSLCIDTGQIVLAGSNPVDVVNSHFERLVITHWKDAIGSVGEPAFGHDAKYAASFRRVGAGVVDWFALARRLRDVGYAGWIVLELDRAEDPIADVGAARQFIETSLATARPFSRSGP